MEEIVSLLRGIYTNGNGNRSYEEVLQHSRSPDFVKAMFVIASAPEQEIGIRHVAVIVLDRLIQMGWFEQVCPPEFRSEFLESICSLVAQSQPPLRKTASHLAKSVVIAVFFKNQWPGLVDIIKSSLSGAGSVRLGLVLANAVCSKLNQNQEMRDFGVAFAESIKPELLKLIAGGESLDMMALAFSCLARAIEFFSIDAAFGVTIEKVGLFSDPGAVQDLAFENFGVKLWKYYRALLKKMAVDWPQTVFERAVWVLGSSLPMKVRCGAMAFISDCLRAPPLWPVLGANLQQLIESVFFPLFVLTDTDVENAVRDPVAFVHETNKISKDFDDLKASAAYLLKSCADDHREIVSLLSAFAQGFCDLDAREEQAPHAVFGIADMCVSVMPRYSDAFPVLFGRAGQLAMSTDIVRKAAGLFLLSHVPVNMVNQDFLNMAITGLNDENMLVQYYSALMLPKAFEAIEKMEEMKASIPDQMINTLFQSILALSAKFADLSLGDCLFQLVSFFGERTLPIAEGLFEQFLKMGVDHSNANALSNAILSFTALQNLISIMARYPQQMDAVFQRCFQLLMSSIPELANQAFVTLTFYPALKFFISKAPFNKNYWTVLQSYNPEFRDEYAYIIEILCKRDTELLASPEIVSALISRIQEDVSEGDVFPIVTGLLLRVPPGNAEFDSIMPHLFEMILRELATMESENVVKAANALVISRTQALTTLSAESFSELLRSIIDCQKRDITPMALIHVFPLVSNNPDAKLAIITALITLAGYILSAGEDEDDDDDDDESDTTCSWFSKAELIHAIHEFFSQIQRQDPSLLSVLTESQMSILSSIANLCK